MIVSCFLCVSTQTSPSPAPCWILVSPSSCPFCSSFVQRDWRQVAAQGLGHDDATLTYPHHELGGGREEVDSVCECVYVSTHVVYVSEMRTHPNVPFTETCVHVSIRKTCMPFILSCWLVMLPGFIHVAYNFMSIKDGASAHQLRGQWLRCAAECGSTRRKGWQRVSGGRTAGLDTPPSPARIACLVGAPPLPHWRNIQYTTVTHTALKEKC